MTYFDRQLGESIVQWDDLFALRDSISAQKKTSDAIGIGTGISGIIIKNAPLFTNPGHNRGVFL